MCLTPIITWINAENTAPAQADADSNGGIWVAGVNSAGDRLVRLENWKQFRYHPQYTIEWARTGI